MNDARALCVCFVSTMAQVRLDGRSTEMLRRQRIHRNYVPRACGSARYQIDGTIVVAAIHGPMPVKPWKEDVEKCVVEVELNAANEMNREEERACEARIRGAIEGTVVRREFPRLGLRVSLRVCSDDGNVEAACVNAVCTALIDADIPMFGLICASSCAILSDGRKVIDPTRREEAEARAIVRACALTKHRDKEEIAIVGCSTVGALSEEEYLDCIAFIVDATASVAKLQKKSIARFELEGKRAEDEPAKKRPNVNEPAETEGMANRPVG